MARILILSVGAGAGHNRAAEALQAAGDTYFTTVQSEWMDSLRFKSKFFEKMYAGSYLFMAKYSPQLWGMLYKAIGKKGERQEMDRLVRAYDRASYSLLMKTVHEFKPDAVLCTHFLPANVVIAHGKRVPIYTIVTDFDVHAFWVNKKAAGYFVASEEVAWQMRHYDYPADKTRITGIPIHPSFQARRGREVVRRELGIPPQKKMLFFMSGGFGVGDMGAAVDRILSLQEDFRLVVICGKNRGLQRKIQARVRSSRGRLMVRGFVTNVQDYMEASDLAITKSGGLSSSECLARGLPMIVFAPIPGQEERNCNYLMEQGAAVMAKGPEVLDFKVRELLKEPGRLATMKKESLRIARPDAAREVLTHVLQDLR